MTDMTRDELNAIINAAKARQADVTQGAWRTSPHQLYDYFGEKSQTVVDVYGATILDAPLIAAAPKLNAAVIALDAELAKVKTAWEVEATTNLDLTKELQAARARITALTEARNVEYRASISIAVEPAYRTVNGVKWQWDACHNDHTRYPRHISGGKGLASEADARAAGQAYIDNLTAPEVTL